MANHQKLLLLIAMGAAVLLAMAGLSMLFGGKASIVEPPDEVAARPSELRADFQLPDLGGGTLGPPDFVGKLIVADFWATWCTPCRVQAEMLEKLFHELDPADVQFLAINVGEDNATVGRFVENTPFSYPVLLDEEDQLMQRYGMTGLPTVLIANRKGEITYQHAGIVDSGTLRLELIKAGLTLK